MCQCPKCGSVRVQAGDTDGIEDYLYDNREELLECLDCGAEFFIEDRDDWEPDDDAW